MYHMICLEYKHHEGKDFYLLTYVVATLRTLPGTEEVFSQYSLNGYIWVIIVHNNGTTIIMFWIKKPRSWDKSESHHLLPLPVTRQTQPSLSFSILKLSSTPFFLPLVLTLNPLFQQSLLRELNQPNFPKSVLKLLTSLPPFQVKTASTGNPRLKSE